MHKVYSITPDKDTGISHWVDGNYKYSMSFNAIDLIIFLLSVERYNTVIVFTDCTLGKRRKEDTKYCRVVRAICDIRLIRHVRVKPIALKDRITSKAELEYKIGYPITAERQSELDSVLIGDSCKNSYR